MTEAQYQRELEMASAEEDFIAERMKRYMSVGGICDPYQADNFCEAIAEADDQMMEELDYLLKAEKLDFWAIGKKLCDFVQEHCEQEAMQMAEDDLEEEKNEYF